MSDSGKISSDHRNNAVDWRGLDLRIDGNHIKDQFNRCCFLRGVNLAGCSKLPSNQDPNDADHFYDTRSVSFVDRPFPLADAPYHLAKLRDCGHSVLRLLVTWEAIEHAGLGQYDYAYMDYLTQLCALIDDHGMRLFIDAHQDIWSRVTGGSGAPGWTVELAGYDLRRLDDAAAAYQYPLRHQKGTNWSARPGDGLEEGVWPSGYQKSSAATLSTLFWGGEVFAPSFTIDGRNIQTVLQDAYIAAFSALAHHLRHSPAVLGYELMNEPHRGYIELDSFEQWNYNTDLHIAHVPSPIQSLALGMGHTATVDYYERTFPFPTRKTGTRTITPHGKAFRHDRQCPWMNEGVWAWSGDKGKAVVLREDYFKHNARGEKIDWYNDFYWPFARRFASAMQTASAKDSWTIVEPIPNEFYPRLDKHNHPHGLIASPHWYDLNMLFKKTGTWWSVNVQGLSRGMMIWNALYIGTSGLKKNYAKQIGRLVSEARRNLGPVPILFGETGIPMDINDKEGQRAGEWSHHRAALDALISALESHAVGYTLWNYNPANTDKEGDVWNGEDFSLFSQDALESKEKEKDGETDVLDGLRIPDAWVRPYACKVSGDVLHIEYALSERRYVLRMRARKGVTEIYVPSHYFNTLNVHVTGGTYTYSRQQQTVWWDTEDDAVVELTLTDTDTKKQESESWISYYGPLVASVLFMLAAVLVRNWLTPHIVAIKEQQRLQQHTH